MMYSVECHLKRRKLKLGIDIDDDGRIPYDDVRVFRRSNYRSPSLAQTLLPKKIIVNSFLQRLVIVPFVTSNDVTANEL